MTTTTLKHNPKSQISSDESEIRKLIESIHKAHHDKRATAIVALYARNAAVFNLAPPLEHRGRDVQEVQAWLNTWQTPVDLEMCNLEVAVSGDLAFCHCLLHMSGTKKTIEGRVQFWMRETLCLHRKAGNWQIVHEHTSVPFYMDGTLKPAFDLKP